MFFCAFFGQVRKQTLFTNEHFPGGKGENSSGWHGVWKGEWAHSGVNRDEQTEAFGVHVPPPHALICLLEDKFEKLNKSFPHYMAYMILGSVCQGMSDYLESFLPCSAPDDFPLCPS